MSQPIDNALLLQWERDLNDGRKDDEPGTNAWAARRMIGEIKQLRAALAEAEKERDALRSLGSELAELLQRAEYGGPWPDKGEIDSLLGRAEHRLVVKP